MSWITRLFKGDTTRGRASVAAEPLVAEPPRPDPWAIRSVDDLWNHIAYVRGYAPDYFPVRDFLRPEEQMTLDRAFALLRDGVWVAYPEEESHDRRRWLFDALDRAFAAYRDGDEVAGATILQDDFEDAIFKVDRMSE